jgi:L-aminopeptidase/D-esterase-like protein
MNHSIVAVGPNNCLEDVQGLRVGHFTHSQRPTGCSVVLLDGDGAICGVDVRGAAPGTRETELLDPANTVDRVHAVLLTGGSAFGLDAAAGVVRWLSENNRGLDTGYGRVPIVPAAVLFDLPVVRSGDDAKLRPNADSGYAACVHAASDFTLERRAQGNVGAGAGASVGKLFGMSRAMKGGIGQASVQVGVWVVSAMVACNAIGDVIDPHTGEIIAGAKNADNQGFVDTQKSLLNGVRSERVLPGTNTTIGIVATNANLTKSQVKRLAMSAHDGLARAVRPAHTPLDGDTIFTLATGAKIGSPDIILLNVMAAEATARAIVNAVLNAESIELASGWLYGAKSV